MDIELLCLTLGIQKTAYILETSEESLQAIMGSFVPDNQIFFSFIKDTLVNYIKKVGNRVAEERLGVSSYVLDKLLQKEEDEIVKKQKYTEIIESSKIQECVEYNEFSRVFKKQVLRFFNTCNDVELTSSKFCVTPELIASWIRDSKNASKKKKT